MENQIKKSILHNKGKICFSKTSSFVCMCTFNCTVLQCKMHLVWSKMFDKY